MDKKKSTSKQGLVSTFGRKVTGRTLQQQQYGHIFDSNPDSIINQISIRERTWTTHKNITNFECSKNFPNSGVTSLIFQIIKALRPLPNFAKKKKKKKKKTQKTCIWRGRIKLQVFM